MYIWYSPIIFSVYICSPTVCPTTNFIDFLVGFVVLVLSCGGSDILNGKLCKRNFVCGHQRKGFCVRIWIEVVRVVDTE